MHNQRQFMGTVRPIAGRLMRASSAAVLFFFLTSAGTVAHAGDDDDSALKNLPRKALTERVAVTVNDFHSSSSAVTPLMAKDMFTTALIESGQFRVVERVQIPQSIIREKPLNAPGQADGTAPQKLLRGAQYIFEGSVSEANAGASQKLGGINFGGLNLGGGGGKGTIAVDVRILDADTGEILDSVTARKAIKSSGVSVGGTAAFASNVASLMGRSVSPMTPDVNVQSTQKEGADAALRACIDASVLQLIKRLPAAVAANTGA